MGIFIKLALRNLFRNKKRTIISAIAIGFGLTSIILFTALTSGMSDNMIKSGTKIFSGEGEIIKKGYNKNPKIENTIKNSKTIFNDIKNENLISGVTRRTEAFGMIKATRDFSTILVIGIDSENEKNVSQLAYVIKKGKYLKKDDSNSVLISERTAKKLSIGIGDKVVVTTPQANSKKLSEELFRVKGIFSFGIRDLDKNVIFIDIKKAKSMMKIKNPHKISFKFKNIQDSRNKNLKVWQKYNKDGNVVLSWEEMLPELKSMLDMSEFSLWITAGILFLIVAFGILNTLFMSIYERMFEFGVLKAIGTSKKQLGFMIVLEAFWLGIFSIVIGGILSIIFIFTINYTGGITAYSGMEYAGSTIQNAIYMNGDIISSLEYSLILLIFILLISLYPALHAAKITPSKAMRERKI